MIVIAFSQQQAAFSSAFMQLHGLLYLFLLYRKRNIDLLVTHFARTRNSIVKKCEELTLWLRSDENNGQDFFCIFFIFSACCLFFLQDFTSLNIIITLLYYSTSLIMQRTKEKKVIFHYTNTQTHTHTHTHIHKNTTYAD